MKAEEATADGLEIGFAGVVEAIGKGCIVCERGVRFICIRIWDGAARLVLCPYLKTRRAEMDEVMKV